MDEQLLQTIKKLYYEKKLSIKDVSKEVNLSTRKVRELLHQHFSGARSKKQAAQLHEKTRISTMRLGLEKKKQEGILSELYAEKKQGIKNKQAKLTEQQVLSIRKEFVILTEEKGFSKRQSHINLASKYNVSRNTISSIVRRDTWKHI